MYGRQWRNFCGDDGSGYTVGSVDQIEVLVDSLKNNPTSRRHILTAWNPVEIEDMALPPCHLMSMFSVTNDKKLNCKTIIRSNDAFLGAPFNIASYALLTRMLAKVCGLKPGTLYYNAWDFHIYANHIDAVKEQLTRDPKPFPVVEFTEMADDYTDPGQFHYEDIVLGGYDHHPKIKAELNT